MSVRLINTPFQRGVLCSDNLLTVSTVLSRVKPLKRFRVHRRVHSTQLKESVGKTTLRALGELCGSAVIDLSQEFHRRDAERAELTLRKTIFPTDSSKWGVNEDQARLLESAH